MGTDRAAIEKPSYIENGDNYKDETGYDARGPRDDGTSKVPDRRLNIRRR